MTLAVVTGANKGIGYEIVGQLARSGYKTILCARNEELGRTAADSFIQQGLDVEYRQLDISDKDSIASFAEGLNRDYGKLDVLVSNAAIAFKDSDPTPFKEQAAPTINVNYFSTLHVIEALLPLLNRSEHPRIVNVASQAGLLKFLTSQERKDFFISSPSTLTISQLNDAMNEFIRDVVDGTNAEKGWSNSCYCTSKCGVIALTNILARENPNILVNACCPGYCDTDMTSHKGPRPASVGAETPVMLALLEKGGPTGKFYYDKAEIQW